MKRFYIQVQIDLDDEWDVESLSDDLYRTGVRIELNEEDGFDGVVNRVSLRPF